MPANLLPSETGKRKAELGKGCHFISGRLKSPRPKMESFVLRDYRISSISLKWSIYTDDSEFGGM